MAASDDVLFEAWRGGDRVAGDALVARHDGAVRRFIECRIGVEVEDVVQNVWVALTRCRQRFERRSNFQTFLFGIARNQVRELQRRSRRSEAVGPWEDDGAADPAPEALTVVEQMDAARKLADALAELPPEMQRLIALYYFEHRRGRELGEMFGIPENTARSRIRKAKALLRDELGESTATADFDFEGNPVSSWLSRLDVADPH